MPECRSTGCRWNTSLWAARRPEGDLGSESQEYRECRLTRLDDAGTPREIERAREDQHGAIPDRAEDLV